MNTIATKTTVAAEPNPADSAKAALYLASTSENLLAAVRGLNDAQWHFKSADNQWSIAGVVEHLAIVEGLVHARVEQMSGCPADDPARQLGDVDEAIIVEVPLRTQKVEAPPPIQPTGAISPDQAVAQFTERRRRTEQLLQSAPYLRGRVSQHPVLGPLDGYQWILAVAAHSARHTAQIAEIKTHPDFPATTHGAIN